MANRCKFESALPRPLKRMLTLMSYQDGLTVEQAGIMRSCFVKAHNHHRRTRKDILSGKLPLFIPGQRDKVALKEVEAEAEALVESRHKKVETNDKILYIN